MSIVKKNGTETYAGKVVEVYSKVIQVMSDMWDDEIRAVVLEDDGTYSTKSIGYRDFARDNDQAKVDATPEQIEVYKTFKANEEAAYKARMAAEAAAKETATVKVGKMIHVVRGRKVAKGTAGLVFWLGHNQWGKSVGFRTSDNKGADGRWSDVHFTSLGNVEVLR